MKDCNNAKDHGAQKTGKLILLLVCAAALLFACENAAYNEALLAIQENAGGGTKTGNTGGTETGDAEEKTDEEEGEDSGEEEDEEQADENPDAPNVDGGEGGYTGIAVLSITLDQTTLELGVDETAQLTATTDPPGVPVTWFSSKKSAVTVSETGLVTMLSGEATVTAKAGGKSVSCVVSMKAGSELAGLYQITNETEKDYIDLSARTEATMLAKALAYIKENGSNNTAYEILLDADETTDSGYSIGSGVTNSSTGNRTNLTITLKGTKSGDIEENITITKGGQGALFTVRGNTSTDTPHLILENITLIGNDSNNEALVSVGYTPPSGPAQKGELTMRAGGRITGNAGAGSSGGGVKIFSIATFTMEGGKIDNNIVKSPSRSPANGGGVYSMGTFTMSGGSIESNIVGDNESENKSVAGGGVYSKGTFVMSGGTIKKNKCLTTHASPSGAAVYAEGIFQKTDGGVIYGKEEAAGENANTIKEGRHVIAFDAIKWRDTTADESVSLDSTTDTNWGE